MRTRLFDQRKKILLIVAALSVILVLIYQYGIRPTANFPIDNLVEIKRGATVSEIAENLHSRSVIRSPLLYKILVQLVAPTRGVIAGDYLFDTPQDLFSVVMKTTDLFSGIGSVRVTVQEGMNNNQIADLLAGKFDSFNRGIFLKKAASLEGYLFPDTYIFAKGVNEDEIIRAFHQNFELKVAEYQKEIDASGRTLTDIITMASIVEREARTTETRKTIADILWRRNDAGMLLQVDAVFYYLFGKPSSELTTKDLQVDSPYNTYKYKGLPVGPIGNPGIYAIRDVLETKKNNYIFYLSDRQGNMHYAKTYETHLANKRRYLD